MIKSDIFSDADGGTYLVPDNTEISSYIVEEEAGGVALSDPSEGIYGYTWRSSYTALTGTITLQNTSTMVSSNIISGIMGLIGLSFAFDSNMRPAIGYYSSTGVSSLYYYDSVTEDYATITLPAGSGTPRLCHDDKREIMVRSNVSDVLVFYIRDSLLYYRLQRERYVTEHQVATVTPGTTLKKVGMSSSLQLKIQLEGGTFISSP